MKDSSLIRTILFNALLVLTLLVIYLLFFPKKSYVKEKLDNNNPEVEEIFNSNINNMKVASINYFKIEKSNKVTLQELIDRNLINELKDSTDSSCDNNSYVKREDNKLIINLKCTDKEDTREITLNSDGENEGMSCIYEYSKNVGEGYSDWSDWSEWSKDKIEKDEYTNVEEKVEKEEDGKETVTKSREFSIDATYNNGGSSCPAGYSPANGTCKKKEQTNTINANADYSCPKGYSLSGKKCVGSSNTINAAVKYSCPSNQVDVEYIRDGSVCRVYTTTYTNPVAQGYYTCPGGYYLSGDRCYGSESYNEEVTKYKEVTYYRYQKREKLDQKIETIWGIKDNQELLSQGYTMGKVITCEF